MTSLLLPPSLPRNSILACCLPADRPSMAELVGWWLPVIGPVIGSRAMAMFTVCVCGWEAGPAGWLAGFPEQQQQQDMRPVRRDRQ